MISIETIDVPAAMRIEKKIAQPVGMYRLKRQLKNPSVPQKQNGKLRSPIQWGDDQAILTINVQSPTSRKFNRGTGSLSFKLRHALPCIRSKR